MWQIFKQHSSPLWFDSDLEEKHIWRKCSLYFLPYFFSIRLYLLTCFHLSLIFFLWNKCNHWQIVLYSLPQSSLKRRLGKMRNKLGAGRAIPWLKCTRFYVQSFVFLPSESKEELWFDLKAAAESGWDFSTRWYIQDDDQNSSTLRDTRTSRILPVDLNALLCRTEKTLAAFHQALGEHTVAFRPWAKTLCACCGCYRPTWRHVTVFLHRWRWVSGAVWDGRSCQAESDGGCAVGRWEGGLVRLQPSEAKQTHWVLPLQSGSPVGSVLFTAWDGREGCAVSEGRWEQFLVFESTHTVFISVSVKEEKKQTLNQSHQLPESTCERAD